MDILLVGCGRMGGAMVRGWRDMHHVLVFDPMIDAAPGGTERLEALNDLRLDEAFIVVLAIKPQMFAEVAPTLRPLAARGALFVSLMAGITLDWLNVALGCDGRAVRTMPNTPATIGRGITAVVAGAGLQDGDWAAVDALLASTGEVTWLDSEGWIDAVTAVSGSGPAYFFRFTEALARAGEAEGLPPALAMRLARATFTGAAALAEADPAELAELRRQVTSPGGTTAAGLAQMDDGDGIDGLARAVVAAAAARSRNLNGA